MQTEAGKWTLGNATKIPERRRKIVCHLVFFFQATTQCKKTVLLLINLTVKVTYKIDTITKQNLTNFL